MDKWVPNVPSVPTGDGAFERFLSAAIAAIITIMFSWRLLDRLSEEEEGGGGGGSGDGNSVSDDTTSSRSSPSSIPLTALTSSSASQTHRALPSTLPKTSSVSGRRQLPAIPVSKNSQHRLDGQSVVVPGGLIFKVTDLKPFIRVPVDLPLCGDISSDQRLEEGRDVMTAMGHAPQERKRKGEVSIADGEENFRGTPLAKECRLSEPGESNHRATRARDECSAIDHSSPASFLPQVAKVEELDRYATPGTNVARWYANGDDTAVRAIEHNDRSTKLPSANHNNNTRQDGATLNTHSSSSFSHRNSSTTLDQSTEELVDSSCDDIAVEVDSIGEERFLDVSGDSGKEGIYRLNIDPDDEISDHGLDEYHPYPLREVADRVRIVGRSRDDTDIDYNSYVLHDDEDEFYITSSIARPDHRTPRAFQRHFSDDYEDDDDDQGDYNCDDERGTGPREYDVDEEMYCSMLEPIMEEDSDDISSTSGSEVDRASDQEKLNSEETSFEETSDRAATTHFSVPSLTSAPLRYSFSSSSSPSLHATVQSSPVGKRNMTTVDADGGDLPPLSRSVGRNCDLDKVSRTPHLSTTSRADCAVNTIAATHNVDPSEEDARKVRTKSKPDYCDDHKSRSTHLCLDDAERSGEIGFDRSHLDQYKIQLPEDYLETVRTFGSSVDGDLSGVGCEHSKVTRRSIQVGNFQKTGDWPPVTGSVSCLRDEANNEDIPRDQCVNQTLTQTFSSPVHGADDCSNSESDESVQTIIVRHLSSDSSSGTNSNNSPVHCVTARLSPVKSRRPLSDSIVYNKLSKGETPEASAFDRGRIVSEGGAVSFEEEQSKQIEDIEAFDLRAYKSYDNLLEGFLLSETEEQAKASAAVPSDIRHSVPTPSSDYVSHGIDPTLSGDWIKVGPRDNESKTNIAWNSIAESNNRGQVEDALSSDPSNNYNDCGNVAGDKSRQQTFDDVEDSKRLSSVYMQLQPGISSTQLADSIGKQTGAGVSNAEIRINDSMDYRRGDVYSNSSFTRSDIDDRYEYGQGDREEEGDEEEDWEQNHVETFIIPKTSESHIIKTLQNVKNLLDQRSASGSRSELYPGKGASALQPMDFDEECQSTCTTTLIEVTGHDAMGFHGNDDERSGYRDSRNALARTDRDLKDKMGFQLDLEEFKLEDYNTESGWPIVRYMEKERAHVDEEGFDNAQQYGEEQPSEEVLGSHERYSAGGFDYPMRSDEYHQSDDETRNVYVVRPVETVYLHNNDAKTQKYDVYDDNESPSEYMNVRKETEFPATLELERSEPVTMGMESAAAAPNVEHDDDDDRYQEQSYAFTNFSSPHLYSPHVASEDFLSRRPRHDNTPDQVVPERMLGVEESPVLSMPKPHSRIERPDIPEIDHRYVSEEPNVSSRETAPSSYNYDQYGQPPKHSTLAQQSQPPSTHPTDSGFQSFFMGMPSLGRNQYEGYEDFVRDISEVDDNAQLGESDTPLVAYPSPLDSAILSGNLASPRGCPEKFLFPGRPGSTSATHDGSSTETSSPLEKADENSNTATTVSKPNEMPGYNFGVRKSSTCSVLNEESNNILNVSFNDSEISGVTLERYDSEPGFGFNRSRSRDSLTDSPMSGHGSSLESHSKDQRANPPTKLVYASRTAPTVSTEPTLDVVLENPSPKTPSLPSPNLPECNTRLHSRSPITTFSYVPMEESPRVTATPDALRHSAVEITSSAVPPAGLRASAKRSIEEPREKQFQPEENVMVHAQPPTKFKRQEEMPSTEQKTSFRELDDRPVLIMPSVRDFANPTERPQVRPVLQSDTKITPFKSEHYEPEDQRGQIEAKDQLEVGEEERPKKDEVEEYIDSRGEEDLNGSDEDDEDEEEGSEDDEDDEESEDSDDEEDAEVEEEEDEKGAAQKDKDSKIVREEVIEKTESLLDESPAPMIKKQQTERTRNYSYSMESGEDVYPHDSSSGSQRTSPVISSDSASALEMSHTPVSIRHLSTSPSSIVTTPNVSPSRLKTTAWAHAQFVPNSGHPKPKSLKELKKKYKPYRSILTQEPPSPTPRPAPFQLPESLLTPSRLKVLYSRDKFLSEQNLQSSGTMAGEFESRKAALLAPHNNASSKEPAKERRYTSHAKVQSKWNSQEQLQKLKNMIRDNSRRKSESSLNKLHECLHDDCILSEEGRRQIIDKSLSIDNLHADMFLKLRRLGSESDAGALGDAYFPETESDLYDLTFPMQDYTSLERPASMSELRHASDYSTFSGMASDSVSLHGPRGSSGKGRFAQRINKKSKSLCTLETDLDDDAFAMSPTEDGMKRVPSVHELRISKSLQKLNVPDWYKSSSLSKSGSCLLKYGSSSTMSSFQFSPSLISSPCTTPSTSSNVVIKTRVITPTSARNLRSPRYPMSAPTTPSYDHSPKSVKLPSDKYRTTEKSKSLMPIPIVPFDKIRAMFEKDKSKEKKKPSSSAEKENKAPTPTSPTKTLTSPPTSSVKPPNTLALNARRDEEEDYDDDMLVPKIIVSPTEPHVKSILKRPIPEKRYSDIQEISEADEEPNIFRPAATYPSQMPPVSSVKESSTAKPQMTSPPMHASEEHYGKPVREKIQPVAQVQRPAYTAPPVKEHVIQSTQQTNNERVASPKGEQQTKKQGGNPKAAPISPQRKEAKDAKPAVPVAKPRGFNFFKSFRSFSSSSSEDGKEGKGRKSPLSEPTSPKQSPNSSYDSSGFPASPPRKLESPEQLFAPSNVPVNTQGPPKPIPTSSRHPHNLMAMASPPKVPAHAEKAILEEAPTIRPPTKVSQLEDIPTKHATTKEVQLEDAPPVHVTQRSARVDEAPTLGPSLPTDHRRDEKPIRFPDSGASLEEAPRVRPPVQVDRFEAEPNRYPDFGANLEEAPRVRPPFQVDSFEAEPNRYTHSGVSLKEPPRARPPVQLERTESESNRYPDTGTPLKESQRERPHVQIEGHEAEPTRRIRPVQVDRYESEPNRYPDVETRLQEDPRIRPPVQVDRYEAEPNRYPDVETRLQEDPRIRPPVQVDRYESESKPRPPVPTSKPPPPPSYDMDLDDTLDKIEKRMQAQENAAPPKPPEKKRWMPKPKGLKLLKSTADPPKTAPKKKATTPEDHNPKSSDFAVNEMSYEPRRLRSSRSSGLNDSMMSDDSAFGRAPYSSLDRPYGHPDKSRESRLSRDLDEPVRRPSEDSTRSYPREDRIQGRAATRDLDRSGPRGSNRSLDKQFPPNDKDKRWRPKQDLDLRLGNRDVDNDRRDIQNLERRDPARESNRRGISPGEGLREIREPFRSPDRREAPRNFELREPYDADRGLSMDRGAPNHGSIQGSRDPFRGRKHSDTSDIVRDNTKWRDDHINRPDRVDDKSQSRGRWQPKARSSRGSSNSRDTSSERLAPNTNGAPSLYRYPVEGSAFSSSQPNTASGLSTPPTHRRMDGASKGSEHGMREPPKSVTGEYL